jgi:CDGSH-type Zn-finger protein
MKTVDRAYERASIERYIKPIIRPFAMGESIMSEADIPQKAPFKETEQQGKTYFWCSCGKSARQPFCDGSHKDTGFEPVKFTAEKDGEVYFCGCKDTAKQPMCDGDHIKV